MALRLVRIYFPSIPLLIAVIVLSGCFGGPDAGGPEISAVAPEAEAPPRHAAARLESTLRVPIDIPVSEMSALVNKVVPDTLYRTRDLEVKGGIFGVSLDLDIFRDGAIETYTAFGSVFNKVPLAARGRVRIPPGVWRPFESTFIISATTDLSLDPEWRTGSTTHATMIWGEEPYITVAGIKLSLKGTAENAMREQLDRLTPEIDAIIEKEVDLRGEVDDVWSDLTEPIRIRDRPEMWLFIRPSRAYYIPPESVEDTLVVELWVGATVETQLGGHPSAPPIGDLPSLYPLPDSMAQRERPGFRVSLPVSVSYRDAEAIIAENLKGQSLELQEQVALQMQGIDLYGQGRQIVARVDFVAQVEDTPLGTTGRVYFTGRPAYDPEEQVVRVDSFDFDVRSRDALTQAAAWILSGGFLERTRDQLRFSVESDIENARRQLAAALAYRPIGKHIVVSGTIDSLSPGDIYLVDEGINVDIYATGQLEARLRRLDEVVKKVPKLVDTN